MCMMCVKTVIEASVVSFAAIVSGMAFIKTKYHLHRMSKCDKNGHCDCGCHCACHQNECDCECHRCKEETPNKTKVKKGK